ncbi:MULTISPECIES: class II fructose-bisphosphate aldolase [unclassified Bacillus (in: firmicutes)]|uniref:class II fructose-bisphosphate aldolase n=1 Tax=unclassified Bacillus (in: firmicutes) TaxID=185979 RepID=UPI0006611A1B|nr:MULTISPECIES: class II fructose-bisphosphate aldolase [unclassified Bacillus (in: firmicutes)]CAI9389140.1 D-tagatose-1,6-bisphosphate aldolase subunit GatY [Bacillus sp. T2.9-1]
MLVTLKELLIEADKENYAVGAFNCPTLESVRGVVEAAEDLRAPIILAHAEVHNTIIPLEIMGPILVEFAQKASVPIAVHLDHGTNLEMVKQAIDIGFTSVMIDASHKGYEENIQIVKEVVEYAHKQNVSVEAELGMMTSSGLGGEETYKEKSHASENAANYYTDPSIAKDFVEKTNIDALAASFGTVHGIYVTKPNLDFDRLERIYENIQKPVVMHGGSGLSEEEYKTVINRGVRKINYYSYAAKAGAYAVKEYLEKEENPFYHDLTVVAKETIKQDIKKAISIFSNK